MSSPNSSAPDPSTANGRASNPDAASGRDPHGRFAKGNPGGKGNPFARRVAALRQALMDAVTEEDIVVISKKLVEKAREGDVAAARLVLGYAVGKPQPAEDPDRLDEKEWRQFTRETVKAGEMESVMGGMSTSMACTIAGAAVPAMQAAAQQSLLDRIHDMDEEQRRELEEDQAAPEQDPTPDVLPHPARSAQRDQDQAAGGRADAGKAPATDAGTNKAELQAAAAKVLATLREAGLPVPESIKRAANRTEP